MTSFPARMILLASMAGLGAISAFLYSIPDDASATPSITEDESTGIQTARERYWANQRAAAKRERALKAAEKARLAEGRAMGDRRDTPSGPPKEFRHRDVHESNLRSKTAKYDESDGGGEVSLIEAPESIRAAEMGEYVVRYEVGPLGIAEGGRIDFQVSPFWGWSEPQLESEEAPGFTEVTTDASVATLDTAAERGVLSMKVEGGGLLPGEAIWIRYGKGGTARVDRYADDEEAFFLWVDGDGGEDESRKRVRSDMRLRIGSREARALLVTLPSVAGIGEEFELAVALLDAAGNRAEAFVGEVSLISDPELEVADQVTFVPEDRGAKRIKAKAISDGLFYIEARVGSEDSPRMETVSNLVYVSERPRRMIWADLQIHSSLSDGTASPEALYEYARDVARLDAASVTDHDFHGMRKLDEEPELWERIREVNAAYLEPGRFVSILGYEWTSWIYGHRHVLYFGDDGEVFSSVTPPTDTPYGLWNALREGGHDAMTVPHHPAGGAQALDWSVVPDPEFEPNVEIVSVHGSSEVLGGPLTIRGPIEGHFVRDALAKGYRLGFIGSTDGHDGHPGLAHFAGPCGGLAAILTDDLSREGIRDALRARRTYATSGPRMYIEFSLGAHGMGSVVDGPPGGSNPAGGSPLPYRAHVITGSPLESVELIKNGEVWMRQVPREPTLRSVLIEADAERRAGDYVYLRVTQADGHVGLTSPIWTE